MKDLTEKIQNAVDTGALLRVTLSGRFDKTVKKCSYAVKSVRGKNVIACEKLMPDGKALHANLPTGGCAEIIAAESACYKNRPTFRQRISPPLYCARKKAPYI